MAAGILFSPPLASHRLPSPPPHPHLPPFPPIERIFFCHPSHDICFLALTVNERTEEGSFGVYHDLALNACQILARNQAGFLSTSDNPENVAARATARHLTVRLYYYHLASGLRHYPMCLTFESWNFPHRQMPDSWRNLSPGGHDGNADQPEALESWSEISVAVKARDSHRCRISGWDTCLHTTHIIPKEASNWMVKNRMRMYYTDELDPDTPLDQAYGNLVTLAAHIRELFEKSEFLIAPKDGKLCLSFYKLSEAAKLYHNAPFTSTHLGIEFLYTRFAFSIIEIARRYVTLADIELLEGGGDHGENGGENGGGGGSNSDSGGMDSNGGGGGDDGSSGTKRKWRQGEKDEKEGKEGGKKQRRRKNKVTDVSTVETDPQERDRQELEEDLADAKEIHPFFLPSGGSATGYQVEHLAWYPGQRAVERLKRDYREAHPNIRECSGAGRSGEGTGHDSDPQEEE